MSGGTEAGKRLLDDIAPELTPSRCPLSGGEHETYGGLCHCGWSASRTGISGRRRRFSGGERRDLVAAIESQAVAARNAELAEQVRGLAVLRLTGEQTGSIDPPLSGDWFVDWDEYEEFVPSAAVLALLEPRQTPPSEEKP